MIRAKKFGTKLPEKKRKPSSKGIIGKLSVNHRGFGFVVLEEDTGTDIFISAENILSGAMNGDKVKVKVLGTFRGKREGTIVEVVEHANKTIVGRINVNRTKSEFVPDDKRITQKIKLRHVDKKIVGGTKVVVEIISWSPLQGKIIEILGDENGVGVDILGILRSHGIVEEFPEEVMTAAARTEIEPSKTEISKRIDRRNLKIVTIDGEDAKDLDDGVYGEERGDGFFLGVYIADVSHYVRPNSALDIEAYKRGTSIYPVDRVVPMLPKELSNGICSLNAGVNRLAMACEMNLSKNGKVVDYKIFPTVIHVHRRLSYTQVDKFFEGADILGDCSDNLNTLLKIRNLRKKIHAERGSIDFALPEMKVRLDENGKPIEIIKRIQTLAESVIEECMLLANETVAEHTMRKKIPCLYRVHELASPEKILTFNQLLAHFSLHIATAEGRDLEPRDFQRILAKVKDLPAERVITSYALRSMQQARYSSQCLGHFGLAAKFYTHFTSPIRRYPDLIVHRMLRASLETPDKINNLAKNLDEIANHSSETERRAVDIERESVDLKSVEYMQQFVGQKFDGVIDSVTGFGFFVELDNGVDGLVRVATIDHDYYEFVEKEFALIGQTTGKSFHIGDSVRVRLSEANTNLRQLTFDFISTVTDKNLIAEV
ncbi:MAG: ribonuclease R [Selenomonadaceae bacterium]|nr:ribonuclease R [Selenomonadaceae bacterium]